MLLNLDMDFYRAVLVLHVVLNEIHNAQQF